MAFATPLVTLAILAMAWWMVPASAEDDVQPPYPDVEGMIREPLENVPQGTVACGWDALRYRMRGNIYQANPGRLDHPTLTQFERLVRGDPADVAAVNRDIIDYCRKKQAEIEAAWRDPARRNPAKEVCQYQTELIPLAILTLRVGERRDARGPAGDQGRAHGLPPGDRRRRADPVDARPRLQRRPMPTIT